jgi:hypothetical protein
VAKVRLLLIFLACQLVRLHTLSHQSSHRHLWGLAWQGQMMIIWLCVDMPRRYISMALIITWKEGSMANTQQILVGETASLIWTEDIRIIFLQAIRSAIFCLHILPLNFHYLMHSCDFFYYLSQIHDHLEQVEFGSHPNLKENFLFFMVT